VNILNIGHRPGKYFGYVDSEEVFKENLKEMPLDWRWRTEKVTYNVNSQGYRAPEWKDVDWSNSVLFLGCSYVYGVGINAEQACPHQLSLMIDGPVINLGCPGGSSMFQWINTTLLRSNGVKPKAVIYYWPHPQRVAQLKSDFHAKNLTAPVKGDFNERWSADTQHCIEFLRYCKLTADIVWDCPVLHYHMVKYVCPMIEGIKYMPYSMPGEFIDDARDYNAKRGSWHAGPETNKYWAMIVCEDLQKYDIY
jgi:hypothetical protein